VNQPGSGDLTIIDKLENINKLTSDIDQNVKLCKSIITVNNKVTEDTLELIESINLDIDKLKQEQLYILENNYNSKLMFRGIEYRALELIKIKEALKAKMDAIIDYLKVMEDQEIDQYHLRVQTLLNTIKTEYRDINRVLYLHNTKKA
jgi:hypothetical protein